MNLFSVGDEGEFSCPRLFFRERLAFERGKLKPGGSEGRVGVGVKRLPSDDAMELPGVEKYGLRFAISSSNGSLSVNSALRILISSREFQDIPKTRFKYAGWLTTAQK